MSKRRPPDELRPRMRHHVARPIRDQFSSVINTCRFGTRQHALPPTDHEGSNLAHLMDREQLKAFCADLIGRLGIQPPLTPALLCDRLGIDRGRPIKLQPANLGATTSIGHLVAQDGKDRILFERTAPQGQQAAVIYHEVIHLVLGHLGEHTSLSCGTFLEEPVAVGAPQSLYSTRHEWEAETGALILLEMSRLRLRPNQISTPNAQAEQGVAAAFGFTTTEWA